MAEYRLKPGKVGEKVIGAYEKVEKKFTDAFLEEDAVSDSGYRLKTGKTGESVKGAYKKIEDGVVGAYKRWKMPLSMRFWNDVMRRRAGRWTNE